MKNSAARLASNTYLGLVKNASYLSILLVFSYIFPLIILGFLSRHLGPTHLGAYAIGTALVQLGAVVTDYGFSIFGSYVISRRRDRREFIRRFLSSAVLIKISIFLVVSLPAILLAMAQEKYPEFSLYFVLLIFPLAAEVASPLWIFQGFERFRFITAVNVATRLIFVVTAVLVIKAGGSFWWLPVIQGGCQAVAALYGWRYLQVEGISPVTPSRRMTVAALKLGFGYVLSRIAVATYTSVGPIFIGASQSATQVATYSVAQQLYRAAQSVVGVASQVLYPYMARKRDFRLLLTLTGLAAIGGVCGALLVQSVGPSVIGLIFGSGYIQSQAVLEVLFAAFAFHSVSVLIGYPLFAALGKPKIANSTLVLAGSLQLLLLAALWLSDSVTPLNVAITVLILEILVVTMRSLAALRYATARRIWS